MNKALSVFSVIFLLVFSFVLGKDNAFAKENVKGIVVNEDNISVNLDAENKGNLHTNSLKNYVTIKVTPGVTGVTYKVTNYGVDTVDSVTLQVKSTGRYSNKNKNKKNYTNVSFKKIRPFSSQRKKVNLPMIRTKMTYSADVEIRDGKNIVYKKSYSSLLFSQEMLSKEWLKGTFDNIRDSLDYHFEKHHNNTYVRVSNMKQYLDKSSKARKNMKDKTSSNRYYKVENKKGNSRKVIRRYGQKEYILFDRSSKKLYSYGGN